VFYSGGAWEARDVADLGGEREAEQFTDSGDRDEQLDAVVGARDGPQLAVKDGELAVEILDDRQQRGDRLKPHRRHAVLGELRDRVGLAAAR
jgi:hypothetical protein